MGCLLILRNHSEEGIQILYPGGTSVAIAKRGPSIQGAVHLSWDKWTGGIHLSLGYVDRGSNYPRPNGPGVLSQGGSIYPPTPDNCRRAFRLLALIAHPTSGADYSIFWRN